MEYKKKYEQSGDWKWWSFNQNITLKLAQKPKVYCSFFFTWLVVCYSLLLLLLQLSLPTVWYHHHHHCRYYNAVCCKRLCGCAVITIACITYTSKYTRTYCYVAINNSQQQQCARRSRHICRTCHLIVRNNTCLRRSKRTCRMIIIISSSSCCCWLLLWSSVVVVVVATGTYAIALILSNRARKLFFLNIYKIPPNYFSV